LTSRILTPVEALKLVGEVSASSLLGPIIKVVGIAGPGDPLANEETFTTFELIDREFPHLIKCMSTNGLLLPESIDRLSKLDLRSLTVTINAIDARVGGRIYSWVRYKGTVYKGTEGADLLIRNQLEGVRRAAASGIKVKVNTVLIPGINDGEVEKIAREVKRSGADIMNVMPLIPQADFADKEAPTPQRLEEVRQANERIIGQFKHCRQCRADAVGLIGEGCPAT
jgi:nitrogen fixation protein NifB